MSALTMEIDPWAVRLALIPGVGPRTRRALLARFGSAAAVFQARRQDWAAVPGVGPTLCQRLAAARHQGDEQEVLDACRQHGISVLLEEDPRYPPLLREIPDPPGLLFVAGTLEPADCRSVAIVGTRHATRYGLRQAERLAGELVRAGFTIVSGLARGIDAAAHRSTLAATGRTLAVLGGGILRLYPPEHRQLANAIIRQGALVTEAPPHRPPNSGNFPQRNRVITGLSLGVVVVEAGSRSGALISARHALEQGREVFAVPGPIDSAVSHGCHQLLRDGAKLVETTDDILDELGALVQKAHEMAPASAPRPRAETPAALSDRERRVWQAVGSEGVGVDEVIVASGLPTAEALTILGALEMRRLIRRLGGARVVRS